MMPEKQAEVTPVTISDKMRKQLIKDARLATKEKRYGDVIKIADAILKERPTDETASVLKENAQVYQEEKEHETIIAKIEQVNARERNRYFENLKEKSIPYNDLMQFTTEDEWKDIKERAQNEDPEKRLKENRKHTDRLKLSPSPIQKSIPQEIQTKLKEKLSIEFINTPLSDVISFLQEKSNMNFFLDKEVIDANVNVNIKLNDIPLSVILEYILPKGLDYVVKDDVVHITATPLELRVYDVRDLLINLDDRQSLTAQAVPTEFGEEISSAGESKDTFDRVKEIIGLITNTIEPASWSVNGGKGMIAAREGMLGDIVVTHFVNIHKHVEDLLAALRSSADLQIAIEARFIAVSDNFLEELGHNILKFDTTSSRPSETSAGGDPPGSNAAGGEEEGIFTDTGNIFAGTGVASGASGLNLSYQILNGFFLEGFLRAVQESDEAKTVTAPKITLSNTQRGTIKVVTTISYIESFTIVSQTPQPVMAEIDDGTTFNVRPIVSADRKYVYLEVHPVLTSVTFKEVDFVTAGIVTVQGGGTPTEGAAPVNTIQTPITVKQELSVTVCVPDKGVLMIGGLGKSSETKTSSGTPILSKIPIIKRLFSSNKIDRDIDLRGNLIILIKPTILVREEQETRAFTKRKRDAEIRVPTYGN
jgi:type II secretory pathway component GspD/PulD (secretin)